MKVLNAIEGGVVGAAAITLIHESIKRVIPNAPRMDLLGMQAMGKGLKGMGARVPNDRKLYTLSLTGDLLSNAIFYSLAGIGKREHALARGAALGLAAGLGAVLLPGPMGLNANYSSRKLSTSLLTVGLYVVGGLVAAGVMKLVEKKKKKQHAEWEQRLVTSSMA